MAIAPWPLRVRFADLRVDRGALLLRAFSLPQAFGRALLDERERWALWLPVSFGTGVGSYFALPAEPTRAIAIALCCWSIAVIGIAVATPKPLLRACCIGCATLLLGFCAAKFRSEWVSAPVLMHRVGPVELDGRVETAELHGKGVRAVLAPLVIDGLERSELPRRVRISVRRAGERLVPGAIVRLDAC